jgi:hypothetical protein
LAGRHEIKFAQKKEKIWNIEARTISLYQIDANPQKLPKAF